MKYVGCAEIIKDDFNNVLIVKKKAKRGSIGKWSLINQKLRGKESDEKCLARAAKDILKTLIFDNEFFKDFPINEEESIKVYVGNLKEKYILDKSYDEATWINKNRIDDYDLEELDKEILKEYFK